MESIARKSGRAMLWRGEYAENLEYAVCDVVREAGSLWIARQANPVDGRTVTPGEDEDVWELILEVNQAAGIPPGGQEGDVLVKLSDEDYDVGWAPGGLGTHSEALTDGSGNFITDDAGEIIYVTGVAD
jgi:hypothetical protein